VHDAPELDSRPAPADLVIARFSTEEAARTWFGAALDKLDGTTLLAAGATAPVWWPAEKESERPEWSRRGELPAGRLGLFASIRAEITDPGQFFDYSVHYRGTVEHVGGLVLVPGPKPFQRALCGGPAPHAMALMAWPDEQTRHAWYHGSLYRPYRDQRHRASRTSNVSVRALSLCP
jgi:uncharacterized protein (DUF1330 family)